MPPPRPRAELVGWPSTTSQACALVLPALGRELVGLAAVGQRLRRRRPLDRHGQVAGHQQQRAERDRLARAEIPVGQDAADQRQQIDQRGVGAVLAAGARSSSNRKCWVR